MSSGVGGLSSRRRSQMGHSRPVHSLPVPINVRCYSNSDMIVRHREVTLRAMNDPLHCNKQRTFLPDH